MQLELWLIYSTVAIANIISPGPAILLAISNGMSFGIRSVLISSLGNIMGLVIVSSVAMLGVGAILQTSSWLFTIFKFAGAGYLIYLGLAKLFKSHHSINESSGPIVASKTNWLLFKEGFLIAATNPKAIIFFTALFPMFINSTQAVLPQFYILTATFMFYSYLSLIGYGLLSKSIKNWLSQDNRLSWLNKITGGLFVSMGFGLLTAKSSN